MWRNLINHRHSAILIRLTYRSDHDLILWKLYYFISLHTDNWNVQLESHVRITVSKWKIKLIFISIIRYTNWIMYSCMIYTCIKSEQNCRMPLQYLTILQTTIFYHNSLWFYKAWNSFTICGLTTVWNNFNKSGLTMVWNNFTKSGFIIVWNSFNNCGFTIVWNSFTICGYAMI